jgi:D-glycero-alpha-D-manno-heptose-7-phosphate kinase
VRIDSSAPTRIDLAGGTYDIWPLYLFHERAQTINAALSLRAECRLISRRDYRVVLISEDTGEEVEATDPDALGVDRLPLVARLVKHFHARGVEVRTRSGSPVGAGIAGSSALNIALSAALAAWTGRTLTDEELLTIAMNIEAQVIHVPTGVQDYRPALYGGVSAVELGVTGVRRVPLNVDLDDFSQRVVLAYTGASRQSGINNWDVMQRRIQGDAVVAAAFDGIRDAAVGLREALVDQDWKNAAVHINSEWQHRRQLAPGVSTPAIDAMLEQARLAGAEAGKVCGAGGGGCLFCLTPPERRDRVAAALESAGARLLHFTFEPQGLVVTRG